MNKNNMAKVIIKTIPDTPLENITLGDVQIKGWWSTYNGTNYFNIHTVKVGNGYINFKYNYGCGLELCVLIEDEQKLSIIVTPAEYKHSRVIILKYSVKYDEAEDRETFIKWCNNRGIKTVSEADSLTGNF